MIHREFHEDEFNRKAQELFKVSEALNDNWKLNEKNGKIYLSKKKTISIESSQPTNEIVADEDDPSVAMPSAKQDLFSIEYHVLFHPSYQCPVLYFNAYADGSMISLDDISRIFVEQTCQNEMRNIITQSEHPILFRPYFMLHPCKVNQVLANFPDSRNFVFTFLTLFGPSVQLLMDPEYDKLIL